MARFGLRGGADGGRARLRSHLPGAGSAPTRSGPGLEAALAWALASSRDAVVITDRGATVLHFGGACRAIFGTDLKTGDVLTRAGLFVERVTDHEAFTSRLAELYADPEASGEGEITVLGAGQVRVCAWTSQPIRDADRQVVGRGFLVHDRTEERELAALKSDFLSTVTHELRTPLTSIKGSLQLILGKAGGLSPIDCELLEISLKNTDRLIRLINDILDISRLELGKMELSFAPIALAPLIEEAIAGLRAYAAGRDIVIGSEQVGELPMVEGDRDRLIQVFTNLVSNAVKFSPVGGRVIVRVAATAGGATVAVRDWGIGIRAVDQQHLFQRFRRINPGSSEEPGTGLGLAISKAIVERHRGRIKVESREAEGSTFTVLLPLIAGGAEPPPNGSGQETPAGAPARRTLLLIDDDADLGTVLEVSLSDTYRLLRVERGVQALDVARAERPDLILLDVVLPDLSGYDVLRILRHTEATNDIPVVILTVQPERELAHRLGAADVVAKPIDIDELKRAIAQTLTPRSAGPLRVALGPLRSRPGGDLKHALEAGGHAVFSVGDPWELLRCADEHAPDVAVVEIMAAADDEKTVAFLRGHASTRRLPLVLLTTGMGRRRLPSGCTPVPCATDDAGLVRAVERAARERRATA